MNTQNTDKSDKIKGVVLMVEDNMLLAELNSSVLEDEGCVVISADTLEKARRLLKLFDPDIVILDLMLPDGNGFDIMNEINSGCTGTRVIFLTARREQEYIIQGLEAGGIDYIKKPCDINEFRLRVTNSLATVCEIRKRKLPVTSAHKLNRRELAVACLAARGGSNVDISTKIGITEGHVKNCLSGVYRKLKIEGESDKRARLGEVFG